VPSRCPDAVTVLAFSHGSGSPTCS
jgi:hypothetical protein